MLGGGHSFDYPVTCAEVNLRQIPAPVESARLSLPAARVAPEEDMAILQAVRRVQLVGGGPASLRLSAFPLTPKEAST
jgi:hypothetical protein